MTTNSSINAIDSFFKISERKSSFKKEIIAGLIIFISMCYIIFVQGDLLYNAGIINYDPSLANKISIESIEIITAISAAIASIFMGMYANYPVALASGMGANAYIATYLISHDCMSPQSVFVAVFISGVIFVLVAVTGLRKKILAAIPSDIKTAISIGVGLFILYIGLVNSGIIVNGDGTPTALGRFDDPAIWVALIGIISTLILWSFEIDAAIIIGIAISIIAGLLFNVTGLNGKANVLPSFNLESVNYGAAFSGIGYLAGQSFIQMGNVKEIWANPTFYIAVMTLFMTDFFDTAGTLFGIHENAKIEGDEKSMDRALIVDAMSTVMCSTIGATNVTSFAESTTGVQYGGKTGLTAVTTGMLFLLSIPFIPLLGGLITSSVTTGAMVIVGMSMARSIVKLNFEDKVILASSIVIIMFTVLSYSIGTGIVIGLLTYIILMVCTGKISELDIWLLATSPVLLLFIILPLI